MRNKSFLTVQEVAERLRISTALVLRYIHTGRLPAKLVSSGRQRKHFRVDEADLSSFDFVDFSADEPTPPKRKQRHAPVSNVTEFF